MGDKKVQSWKDLRDPMLKSTVGKKRSQEDKKVYSAEEADLD